MWNMGGECIVWKEKENHWWWKVLAGTRDGQGGEEILETKSIKTK